MHRTRKIAAASLITAGLLVAAPLALSVANAQTTGTAASSTVVDYARVFVGKLASALGVDQARLEAALESASTATIDEALKNGDVTRARLLSRARQDLTVWMREQDLDRARLPLPVAAEVGHEVHR